MTNSYKKEYPFVGYAGFGGGVGALAAKSAATKTYVDEVFSTYLHTGTGATKTITNGIDLSSEGGMVWQKCRTLTQENLIIDSERGLTKAIKSNSDSAQFTASTSITSFNSDGFTQGSYGDSNQSNQDYGTWTFRKSPGWFDIVTWTGTSGYRTLDHSLECIPGFIMIKKTSGSESWLVWHRFMGSGSNPHYLRLDENYAMGTDGGGGSNPNASVNSVSSTQFTVGADNNGSGGTWVAYLFAGGDSDAATARSLDFDGSGDYLVTNTTSDYDFGTGDFTAEHWIKPDSFTTAQVLDARTAGSGTGGNWCTYITTDNTYRFNSDGGDRITSTAKLSIGVWTHCAIVRNSGTTTLYINGTAQGTYSDTNDYDDNRIVMGIHGPDLSSYPFDGKLSNVRVLKGTAVYTSSFKPPTEPLTSITNTKLLCCNNSSITGTTTGTVTSGGDPTASTESPFDDTEGFKFGDDNEGIIKCGSYTGNGSTTGPEIYLGWEPSWVLIKDTSASVNWRLHDSMRGIVTGGNDPELEPNTTDAESDSDRLSLTPTGFKLTTSSASHNDPGDIYVYMAIRRPDGYVGKPAEAGTSVFAMDTGNSSSTIPTFDSGFPVDMSLRRTPASSMSTWLSTRLQGPKDLGTASGYTGSESVDTSSYTWDSNAGWASQSSWGTSQQSWMWKRGQGFDTVCYTGNGVAGHTIRHSLSTAPEMIWVKDRENTRDWRVFHHELNGGSNPAQYGIKLNSNEGQSQNSSYWNDTAPTSTSFTIGTSNNTNNSSTNYIAMLFSSVTGISKCGSYTGTANSAQSISLGFQPRFLIIKNATGTANNWTTGWFTYDTTRGWSAPSTTHMFLNDTMANQTSNGDCAPTATGFDISAGSTNYINNNGDTYIYYAHA